MSIDEEPLVIEGPGMGIAKKSYSKFRDIDASEAIYYGLAMGRKWDEGFVNQFDMRHAKVMSDMEDR